MKASELRLGNWVFDTMLRKEIQMDFEDFACCENFLKSNHFIPYKPIPLTEEKLLNFGFKQDGKYNEANRWMGIFNQPLIQGNGYFTIPNYPLVEIKYVHHLQNLYFALKGKELTLNQ